MDPMRSLRASLGGGFALTVILLTGCGGPIYQEGKSPASAITPRSSWQASGDMRGAQAVLDGDIGTAAVSAAPDGGGSITIDLGKPCVFNMAVIEHGTNEWAFARRVALLTSLDGISFTQRYSALGTRRVTILCPAAPILARYVRLQAVVAGDRPWLVAEVYLQ
jgi:hypothetical protein